MYKLSEKEFEEKYKLYSQELMNISYGYTGNKEDSLDVVQNVFFKLFNCNKSFLNLDDEKYWLIRVTINESKDLLRKRTRITLLDEEIIDTISFNNDIDSENFKLYKLTEKVKQLPEKYRVVTILYYYDLLSVNEIMKILKLSESAVKKRLERARNMLRKEMEE